MTTNGEKWWRREHREIEDRLAGRGGRHVHKRDPIAIAVGVLNLLAFVVTWAWWARGIDSDVVSLKEWRIEEIRARREDAKEKVSVDALQTLQIVELKGDVKYMRETLDRIDKRLQERAR